MQKFHKINFWLGLSILRYIIAYLKRVARSRDTKPYPLADRLFLSSILKQAGIF